ncbi:MAG: hypothetical protein JSR99_11775 [Proteobacteria bacterium]|nr:hypothetical protein [Pseudomonadota bacterium]
MIRQITPRDTMEYFIIRDATTCGPIIGRFQGFQIHSQVTDFWGRHYTYAGIIEKSRHGIYEIEKLKPLEFILEPGIIYKIQKHELSQAWLERLYASWKQNVMRFLYHMNSRS